MKPTVIPTTLIDPDQDQPRRSMDQEALEQLAGNIEQIGQLQPIIVYRVSERYCIADGHRRFAAMTMRGAEKISSLVLDRKPAPDVLLMTQLAANCHRAGLKQVEFAESLNRLKELNGWTNTEVARKMSLSKAKVTQVMSYLSLPQNVQDMLNSGSLPGSTAYAISRAPDDATQQQMLQDALQGNLKRDDASRRVTKKSESKRQVRSTFPLTKATVVITSAERLSFDDIIAIGTELNRECRQAVRQGIDASTLERVLHDQRKSST